MVHQKHLELKNKCNSAHLIHLWIIVIYRLHRNFRSHLIFINDCLIMFLSSFQGRQILSWISRLCPFSANTCHWKPMVLLNRTEGANTAIQACVRMEPFLLLPVPIATPARSPLQHTRQVRLWLITHHQDRASFYFYLELTY